VIDSQYFGRKTCLLFGIRFHIQRANATLDDMPVTKKPANLVYGLDGSPPLPVSAFNGIQHVGLIAINLVYPLLIFRMVDAPLPLVTNLLAIGMLVLGVATFLQALRLGPVGSGYMCPATFTASPSLLAAQAGGLPMVFGMTIFAGLLETTVAPLLNRLRPIFPPEISGLVIFMIGLSGGVAGLRTLLAVGAAPVSVAEWWVAGITLATMITLNVWGTGMARMLCALIGLVVGYIAAAAAGVIDRSFLFAISETSWIGLPTFSQFSCSFDIALAAPFAIASVAAAMKAAGTITVCQRMNDANWVRPDMRSVMRGVLADGVSTTLAGAAGAVGTNTSTPAVGLASATGVASRQVAYAVGVIFLLLGFFPKLTTLLAVMPRPVIVAALLFAVSFIIINGVQVISSRLLDVRRSLVIALSIVAGVAVEVFPTIAAAVPRGVAPLIGSSLVFSTLIALALNLSFRIGVKKTVRLTLESSQIEPQKIEDFLQSESAKWGARPDVVQRATFGVTQLVEVVAENCWRSGPIVIEASFDEFNLDVRVSYQGDALEFPDRRPSNEQIRDSSDGARLLAGFMLRRNADRVRSESKNGKVVVHFHFDH
jgi:xanthine permease XanP